jgi:hypothetical protein
MTPVLDDERFLARARGGEWLPSDHPAASSAGAGWLGYNDELLRSITWLIGEAGSLARELPGEARATMKLDLVPLEREAEHLGTLRVLEEGSASWKATPTAEGMWPCSPPDVHPHGIVSCSA